MTATCSLSELGLSVDAGFPIASSCAGGRPHDPLYMESGLITGVNSENSVSETLIRKAHEGPVWKIGPDGV